MLPCSHVVITSVIMRAIDIKYKPVWLDYRLLIAGSLLPDLIDKMLLTLLFTGRLFDGRYFGHTLLFILALSGLAIILRYWRKEAWLFNIVAGVIIHAVLDEMWYDLGIFFWPFFGFKFVHPVNPAWLAVIKIGGLKIRQWVAWEIISMVVLFLYLIILRMKSRFARFIYIGRIDLH